MATRTPVPAPDGGAFEAAVDAAARFPGGPYRFGTVEADSCITRLESWLVACNHDESVEFGPLPRAFALALAQWLNSLPAEHRYQFTLGMPS
jgi:hypothetical protein